MGSRKHEMAERIKAEKKQIAIASLRDCPTSPRKMRIVADTIRGVEVNRALALLRLRCIGFIFSYHIKIRLLCLKLETFQTLNRFHCSKICSLSI